ncbi:MAG: hypothetical protein ABI837_08640 [Acidobacteriota bacterium]
MKFRSIGLTMLSLSFAAVPSMEAGYLVPDVIVPIVGRATGVDGRIFSTTVWMTNDASTDADVTLTFLTSQSGHPLQHQSRLHLQAGETRMFEEIGRDVLGSDQATGALRIHSSENILASARLFSRRPDEPLSRSVAMGFAGIPTNRAVGRGGSTVLQGVAFGPYRYKLYLVETEGAPLNFSVALENLAGRELARREGFLQANEHRVVDVKDMFPSHDTEQGILRIRGVNGTGRLIAAGAQIATDSQDGSVFEMSIDASPRFRIPAIEVFLYLGVVAVLLVALWRSRQAGSPGQHLPPKPESRDGG